MAQQQQQAPQQSGVPRRYDGQNGNPLYDSQNGGHYGKFSNLLVLDPMRVLSRVCVVLEVMR